MSLPNFFCACYSPCACLTDFDPEFQQSQETRPQSILVSSKITGAKYMRKVSKKELPDISRDAFLYSVNDNFFVLDEQCAFLLGVFVDSEMTTRKFQKQFNEIKEKSAAFIEQNKKFESAYICLTYQQMIQSSLKDSNNSEDFKKSSELLESFKLQCNLSKESKEILKNEIEKLIRNYVTQELATLPQKEGLENDGSVGINISANVKHSLKYFLSIK